MEQLFKPEGIDRLYKTGVIAVLVIDDARDALPLAHALLKGGIDIMELTLRTPAAIDALGEIKTHVPEMMAGIGTILHVDQVKEVAKVGADFGVAPGLNPKVVREAQSAGLPFSPGVVTPSEIEMALDLGCTILKFFPAEPSGGLAYLKNIAAPYAHLNVKYMPLGGLDQGKLKSYLEFSSVLAVGGSWLAKRDLIKQNDWKTITDNARNALRIVREVRGVE